MNATHIPTNKLNYAGFCSANSLQITFETRHWMLWPREAHSRMGNPIHDQVYHLNKSPSEINQIMTEALQYVPSYETVRT